VRDEATSGLTADDRRALDRAGFPVDDLEYRGSAAAIIDDGTVVWQRVSASEAVALSLAPGDTLGTLVARRTLEISSAGFDKGNRAELQVDHREEGFGGRGINVLVLDDEQRVHEVAWFDTHAGSPGVVVRPTTLAP
jgi:hypothetical protein